MTTETSRRRRAVLATIALAVPVWFAMGSAPAHAQAAACVVAVDGADTARHDSPGRALALNADDTVLVQGATSRPTTAVTIRLVFPGIRTSVETFRFSRPAHVWRGTVDLDRVTRFGVGLHQVRVDAGGCERTLWIRITGRSPFTTPLGIGSVLVLLGGLAALAVGLRRAVAGRGGRVRAIVGGAAAGVGALGVTQQFGSFPLTAGWLTSWTLVPGAIGGALHAVLARPAPLPAEPPADAPTWPPPSPAPPGAEPSAAPSPVAAPRAPGASMPAPDGSRAGPTASAPRGGHPPMPAPSTPPPPTPAPTATVELDPPRQAHALLECPDAVAVGRILRLVVGLVADPVAGVIGGPLVRPATSVGPYTLTVQLVADGFRPVGTGAWRLDLPVTAEAPWPRVEVPLVAEPTGQRVAARAVQAIFSVDGQTIGFAVRPVSVVADDVVLGDPVAQPDDEPVTISVPPAEHAPDLTIRVVMGASESGGRLLWTFETPHTGITVPDRPIPSDIGDRPEVFTRKVVDGVADYEGRPALFQYLRGVGLTIADQMPPELGPLLRDIATRVAPSPPSVFLLSEEPYVPWELAVLDPPLDADAPPFLAAQAELGRWVLGKRRPPLPPPMSVEARSMAVIVGVYDGGHARLFAAEEEADQLVQRYAARPVDAAADSILACLQASPGSDVLHFAMHGSYDVEGRREGLILVDGTYLDPLQVKGANVAGTPFVFLNACQVGNGNRLLGDYAGVAASFLYAGAAGVIAPLWSVQDDVAKELALGFYRRALDEGAAPAAILRSERATFRDGAEPTSATHLAYQFFGHPGLRLSRP